MTPLFRRISLLAAAALAAACTSPAGPDKSLTPATPAPARLLLSPRTLTLQVGATRQLFVIVLSQGGDVLDSAEVTYSSSDSAVASVDSSGLIKAKAAGSAVITVKSGPATGTLTLTVTAAAVPPAGSPVALRVLPDQATLTIAGTVQLAAEVTDSAGTTITNAAIAWQSANAAIAAVTATGLVTGVGVGTTYIRATSGALSDSAAITVLTARTMVTGRAFAVAVSSAGAVYVTQPDESLVLRVDASTHQVVATIRVSGNLPSSVTFNHAGTRAYVGNQDGGGVVVINSANNSVAGTISMPARSIFSVAVEDGDSVLLVGAQGMLYFVRLPANTISDSVTIDGLANTLVIRDSLAYVNAADAGTIQVINLRTRTAGQRLNVGGVPQGIGVSTDGSLLYLANEIGEFQVWNLASGTKVNSVALSGGGGFSLSRSPTTGLLYIGTSYFGSRVVVVDPAAPSVINSIVTGGTVRRIGFTAGGEAIVANEGGWIDFL